MSFAAAHHTDDDDTGLFAEHMKPYEVPDEIGEGFSEADRDLVQMVALMRNLIEEKKRWAKASPFGTVSETDDRREKRERSSSDEEGAKDKPSSKASKTDWSGG